MDIFFILETVVPIPDAPGFGIVAPMGEAFTVDDTIGAALVAAGVALPWSEHVPPPPEYADKTEARGLPFPLP